MASVYTLITPIKITPSAMKCEHHMISMVEKWKSKCKFTSFCHITPPLLYVNILERYKAREQSKRVTYLKSRVNIINLHHPIYFYGGNLLSVMING